ncbi:activator of basal transcription 1-like [Coccinella septempunctata]|uniref:activator of basal transcription 1-like n=1 Tax=Coccinella septempunctata TaxID=41139 RepID=UPI001D08D395|nr:activator of basal transcription 1-like [Coccinella septempunctata]
MSAEENNSPGPSKSSEDVKKKPKRGIIYISSIPPYMNVTLIREYFGEFGELGRVYLQLQDKEIKGKNPEKKKKKAAKNFTEGWVEFEKKSVAKKVAQLLNNTQVSNRKRSIHFDYLWNIKYLSGFKWTHLHERLAYEKTAKRQKLRAEIQLAKRNAAFFTSNLNKNKKGEYINREYENLKTEEPTESDTKENSSELEKRTEFLGSLFS